MSDQSARAVAPIERRKVQAIGATVREPQREHAETPGHDARSSSPEPEAPPVAVSAPGPRTTDLAYQVDAESKRISVQVVDRETGSVIRSFPLFMPGQTETIDGSEGGDTDTPRGALVDAKI